MKGIKMKKINSILPGGPKLSFENKKEKKEAVDMESRIRELELMYEEKFGEPSPTQEHPYTSSRTRKTPTSLRDFFESTDVMRIPIPDRWGMTRELALQHKLKFLEDKLGIKKAKEDNEGAKLKTFLEKRKKQGRFF